MIPKIIHYCWFGNPVIPEDVRDRIEKWKKMLPDYKFILWNEDNFDIEEHIYTKEAYESKKFAYVTDYVRLYVLNLYCGIYMDTDVDVILSFDDLLKYRAFTGMESTEICVTGTMGAEKGHPWIKELLEYYDNRNFIKNGKIDLTPNTVSITNITIDKFGWTQKNEYQKLRDNLAIFPVDYLCAKDWSTGLISTTENTYTVHNFNGSWLSPKEKALKKSKGYLKIIIRKVIGEKKYTIFMNRLRKM